jgi:hypothetical protein
MAGAKIKTNVTPVIGELNEDGFGNAKFTLPTTETQSGFAQILGNVDSGKVTGVARLLAAEVSEDFRLRAELDTILDAHTFNETAQVTGKFRYRNTTMTGTWAGNAFNTNASAITTINTGVLMQTYQYFPIFGGAETYAYFKIAFTGTWAVTNKTIDIGFFSDVAATPYAPTDGVYFRANNTGLFGVTNFNGTEQATSPFVSVFGGGNFTPTIGTYYDCIVTIGQNVAVFWMDLNDGDGYKLMGKLDASIGAGVPCSNPSSPFGVRDAIGGTAASAVAGCKIASYTVTQGGFQNTRSELVTAALLTGGQQGQQGQTQGQLTNITNNLAPTAGAAMTNTTAALGTGLGGQFSALPTFTVNSDGILCSFLNPIPASAIAGKHLIIKGVWIDASVTTVLAGNATAVQYIYTLCTGHTALSLATTESAIAKAPRRTYLGKQDFAAAAAVGTNATRIYVAFDRPIPVAPGEYAAIAAKNIGAVTTTGVITFWVGFDWSWVL